MLGPIGSHLLASLKVMTPSEVERVTRSARTELIQRPQALEEEAVSFDEASKAKVVKLKTKKEEEQKDEANPNLEKKEKFKNEKRTASDKEKMLLDDSVIFIEEWAKSKNAKKKLYGINGMKTYQHISNYEPIQVNLEDEDDVLISDGTSGILINKKQS